MAGFHRDSARRLIRRAALGLTALLSAAASASEPRLDKIDLFEAGRDGYASYRTPGIVVTARGSVLAYCDARRTGRNDWENIDLMLRRSTDGGKTWAPRQKLAAPAALKEKNPVALAHKFATADEITYSNPVAIAERDGTVLLFFCLEFSRCFCLRSEDDGVTFSRPVEITASFQAFRPEFAWKVIATGPTHGIELKNGRLLLPVWMSTGSGPSGFTPSVAAMIFSDDRGRTWQRGDIAVWDSADSRNPNCPVLVQLADGRVMLNVRTESKTNRRVVVFSADGVARWSKPRHDDGLPEPFCEASLVRVSQKPPDDRNRILFADPDNLSGGNQVLGTPRERKNLSIKLTYDEGATWPVTKLLEAGPSAYSDLAVLPNGTLLCFYERGAVNGNLHRPRLLTLARFNLAWLTDGKDAGTPASFIR